MGRRGRTGRLGLAAALGLLAGLLAWAPLRPDAAPTAGSPARSRVPSVRSAGAPRIADAAAPAPAAGDEAPVATSSAAAATSASARGWLWRDGALGPGSVLATRLARSGEPVGAAVPLVADAQGRLGVTPLTDGWWRLEPPDPDDSLRAGYFEDRPTTPAVSRSMVVPWGSAGEGPEGYQEADERGPEAPLTVVMSAPLRVHGQVVDETTGVGVPGAWLELERRPGRRTAGPDGRFDHRVARHACRWVEVAVAGAPGYASAGMDLLTHRLGEEFVVRLRRGGLSVEGDVVDHTGAPVEANVLVSVPDEPRPRLRSGVSTGSDGRFRFDGIPAGGGVGPRSARVSLSAVAGEARCDLEHDVSPGGGAPVRLVVRRRASIEVRLRAADGAPLEQAFAARVNLSSERMELGGSWNEDTLTYRDEAQEGALVAVEVVARGRLPRRVVGRLPLPGPIEVFLERAGGASIHGIVRTARGCPAVGAPVSARWVGPPVPLPSPRPREHVIQDLSSGSTYTHADEQGAFSLGEVPAGVRVTLEAKYSRSPLAARRDGVVPDESVELVLPPASAAPRLELRVLAAESGERLPPPLWVAQAHLADEGDEVVHEWTDREDREIAEDGRYALLVDRRLRLWIGAAGRVPAGPFEVHAVEGTRLELGELRLARAGKVELAVGGWPPLPVERLRARWRDPDGRAREAKGPPRERWTLEGLAPGAAELEVEALRGGEVVRRAKITVDVRAGEVTRASIDLGGD